MFAPNIAELMRRVTDTDLVLDVGAWGKPLRRADWVLDQAPYETRGLYGFDGDGEERFSVDRWVRWDICDRRPFPFPDDMFDLVVCSHTLEDVRDPVWVASELSRIGKAGYVEVPSRLEEQTFGVQGPWVGWGHHHWLIDIDAPAADLGFVFKHHILQGKPDAQFPRAFLDLLRPEERVQWLWWEGTLRAHEVQFDAPEDLDRYLEDYVAVQSVRRGFVRREGLTTGLRHGGSLRGRAFPGRALSRSERRRSDR